MADRLELTGPAFTSRAVSFMNLMRAPSFQRAFAADPAGVAMREFHLRLPARTISASNELLASLLKNREFSAWARRFQATIESGDPALMKTGTLQAAVKHARASSARIQREFADGVMAHLPPQLASKLKFRKPWRGQIAAEDDIAILLLVFVAVVVVVVAPKARDEALSRNTVRLYVRAPLPSVQAPLYRPTGAIANCTALRGEDRGCLV